MNLEELEMEEWTARDGSRRTCPHVGHDGKLRTCKRRDCPRCGPRWARDWFKSMSANLAALRRPVVLISITAPGAERLPWDETYCFEKHGRKRKHKHRGPDGCRIQQRAAREWADTCTWRWQKLRAAAALATKRATEHMADGGLRPVILERVWEPQKRGVPHLHIVLPYGTYEEQMVAHCFANELAQRAKEYDFGYVDAKRDTLAPFGRRLKPVAAEEAARYLSSYLTGRKKKGTKTKSSIRENIADPIMPRSLIWLTPKLTSQGTVTATGKPTFVTMRTLRRARQLWAWAKGLCPPPVWQDVFEAAKVALVCRLVFFRRGGGDEDEAPPLDVDELLGFAAKLQEQLGGKAIWKYRCYGEPDWFTRQRELKPAGVQLNAFFGRLAGLEIESMLA